MFPLSRLPFILSQVKAAIVKKDETIERLREQLAEVGGQLRSAEAVLAAQQAEFCS